MFRIKTYTIEVKINGIGKVNYPLKTTANYGDDLNYIFTASTGYYVQSVKVNDVFVGTNNSYLISDIKSDYQIVVDFEIQTYTISWYDYAGQLITTTKVNYLVVPVATFATPTRAPYGIYVYEFSGWNTNKDGSGTGVVAATKNTSYYAQFVRKLVKYEIKASANSGGSISPSGSQMVEHGSSQTFYFFADEGYHLSRVFVDGKIVEFVESYTFENVTETHTISATFKRNDFKVNIINDDEQGEIIGSIWLESGERAAYKIVTQKGVKVERVLVNGNEVTVTDNIFIVESVSSNLDIVIEYSSKSNSALKYLKENAAMAGIVVVAVAGVAAVLMVLKLKKNRKKREEKDEYND